MNDRVLPPIDERRLFDHLAREDFYFFVQCVFSFLHPGEPFVPSLVVEAICSELCWMMDPRRRRPEEGNKLIINCPPRSLKSLICSVAYPLFVLGHNPRRKIMSITYGDELTRDLADLRRRVLEAPFYRRLFPHLIFSKNTVSKIRTSHGGYIIGTSVGGTLTGRGADEFIVDDPIKAADALSRAKRESTNNWLGSTLASRPNNKRKARIILVMQRLHVEDPTGSLMATGQYNCLCIPAIAEDEETLSLMYGRDYTRLPGEVLDPVREPLPVLESLRQVMTDSVFAAQYQQQPVPPEGGLFKVRHFQRYDVAPYQRERDTVVISWDTAFTEGERADYSVGTTWLIQGDRYYLLDLVRERLGFPALQAAVVAAKKRYPGSHILVEKAGSGTSLWQSLKDQKVHVIPIKVDTDKVVRAHQVTPVLEADRIYLPHAAPWLDAFINEVAAFPGNTTHDDQVDSFCQAINWWEARKLRRSITLFGYY